MTPPSPPPPTDWAAIVRTLGRIEGKLSRVDERLEKLEDRLWAEVERRHAIDRDQDQALANARVKAAAKVGAIGGGGGVLGSLLVEWVKKFLQ